MKTLLITILLFLAEFPGFSQHYSGRISLAYSHLYSPQLDRAIKTYNYSRPNLANAQPFIQHGIFLGGTHYAKPKGNFKSGFAVNHGLYISNTSNPNAEIQFNYHLTEGGYLLNYRPESSKFYAEMGIYFALGRLTKRLNGEPFMSDNVRVRSLQLGGTINLNMGYLLTLNEKIKLAPFVSANFAPYFSEGGSESVINQTSTLMDVEYTTFFRFEFGCSVHYNWPAKYD